MTAYEHSIPANLSGRLAAAPYRSRPRHGGFTCRVLDKSGLEKLDREQWERLSSSTLAENPFYSRQYILAGLTTIDRATDIEAVVVQADDGRLAGLFPFHRRRLPPIAWPLAQGAANLYQFSGVPLVNRDQAQNVILAWLDMMGSGKAPRMWVLSNFDMDGPMKELIDAGVAARNMVTRNVRTFPRPHLTSLPGGFDAYARDVIARKRLKDIQRNLRRLRDRGEVRFERASAPALVRERLEQFLEMENAGWKGAGGTAFLSDADHAAFARKAYGGPDANAWLTTIDSLLLDGRPIAMSINISSGATAFTPKCTYDETLRRYGPGLVLEYLIIEHFHDTDDFVDMDSATVVDGHVVLGLWNRRKRIGQLIVGPDDWRTRLLAGTWSLDHEVRKHLKRWRRELLAR